MTKQTVITELGQMGWKFIGNGTWARVDEGVSTCLYTYSEPTDTWTSIATGPSMVLGDHVAPGMTHQNVMWDLEQWAFA